MRIITYISRASPRRGAQRASDEFRVAAAAGTMGLGQSVLFVAVPVLVAQSGLGIIPISVILAAGTLLFLVGSPWWGASSDRRGRLPSMRLALLGYALSSGAFAGVLVGAALGEWPPWAVFLGLLIARLVYGMTASGVYPVAQAWFADRTATGARFRAQSRLSAAQNLARVIGPILALATVGLHPLAPFAIPTLVALGALWGLKGVPESRSTWAASADEGPSPATGLGWLELAGFLLHTAFGGIQLTLGMALEARLGLTEAQAGQALAGILTLTAALVFGLQIRFLGRSGPPGRPLLMGLPLLCLLGSLQLAHAQTLSGFAIGYLVAGMGIALLVPAYASLGTLMANGVKGRVTGRFGMMHTLGYAAGALMGGLGFAQSPALPFLVAAGLVLPLSWILGQARQRAQPILDRASV